jgi:hypothetical protein
VAKAAFNSAVDAVRAGGRVVAVACRRKMSLDIPRLVLDGIEVVGSLVGTRQDLTEAFQLPPKGKWFRKSRCVRWKISTPSLKRWNRGRSAAVWLSIPPLILAPLPPGEAFLAPACSLRHIPPIFPAANA